MFVYRCVFFSRSSVGLAIFQWLLSQNDQNFRLADWWVIDPKISIPWDLHQETMTCLFYPHSTPIKAIQICTGFAKSHYDSNLGCRTLPGNGRFPCDVCSCSIQFLLFIGSMVIFCSLYVPTSSRIRCVHNIPAAKEGTFETSDSGSGSVTFLPAAWIRIRGATKP